MPLIGLYSGSYILKHKDTKGFKLGRSRQTAKSAYNGIMKKYGEIKPGSKYHHVGKNVWRIYSISNDRKRTGKTTADFKKWGKQPHKWDYKGVDTKGSTEARAKRTKEKKEARKKTEPKEYKNFIISKNIKNVAFEKAIEKYELHLATLTRWPQTKLDKEYEIGDISAYIRDHVKPIPEKRVDFRKRGPVFKEWVKIRDEYAKAALSEAIKKTPKSKFDLEKWKAKQKK